MAAMNTAPLRIGLLGPFGLGNLGDAATQQAVLATIRRSYPAAQVVGFSLNPADTERRHGIPSFPISRVSAQRWLKPRGNPTYLLTLNRIAERFRGDQRPWVRRLAKLLLAPPLEVLSILDASRSVRGLDLLLISGGGQLDDYWGGPWHQPYTILVWSLIARARGAKLCFVSVGAGPIDHRASRWLFRLALALADYRSYRDKESRQLLSGLGFRADGPIFPDLAHSLPLDVCQHRPERRSGRTIVAVGAMAYFDPRIWPERDQSVYMGYLTKLAAFAHWLLQTGHDLLLYPGEVFQDGPVIDDLRALLATQGVALADPRVMAPPITTVDELMLHLAAADLVVASRFHGVLLPQLLNIPVLALSYHPKVEHLMADMGQRTYCLPIDTFRIEELKERFSAMSSDRQAIKALMAARTTAYRTALEEQYRRLFELAIAPHRQVKERDACSSSEAERFSARAMP